MKKTFLIIFLLFSALITNIWMVYKIARVSGFAIQSEGMIRVETNLFAIQIVGNQTHTIINYSLYILIIAILVIIASSIKKPKA